MTDPRPRPQYGEYADIPPAPPAEPEQAAPASEVALAPVKPARRTSDVLLTVMLLAIGVWDVVTGFPQYADLSALLRQAFEQLSLGEFTSTAAAAQMGPVINAGRVVILIIAIVISLLLISRNRRAFWVPLAAGAIAAIFVGVCAAIVMSGDPAFIAYQSGLIGK